MHINCHFAIGIIIASLCNYVFSFTLPEYGIIIACSFLMDFDVFFSKMARDNNHRMLITHSIIPGLVLLLIGGIINWPALWIGGIAYIIHVVIDTFDWGTNFLGIHKKPVGAKLLISKEEFINLESILSNYKIKKSFFDFRYYQTKGILIIEIILAVLMVIISSIFAFEYSWVMAFYIPFLLFHLLGYKHLKQIESKK